MKLLCVCLEALGCIEVAKELKKVCLVNGIECEEGEQYIDDGLVPVDQGWLLTDLDHSSRV